MTVSCKNCNWSHGRVQGTEALSDTDANRKVNINRENIKKNDGTGEYNNRPALF